MTGKGIRYEWAFRNELRMRPNVVWAERFAASHGPFDVCAQLNDIPGGWIDMYQCKWKMTCKAAHALVLATWNVLGMPSSYGVNVVHRTTAKEFCEH